MLAIIWLFSANKIEFKLLSLFGLYSYEIYLFHWPILARYDIFYKYTPAWLATALYLVFFLGLAWFFKKIVELILKPKK
jgi:peptidoglycan/LPS O-acetylase OafA/YrhL